MPMHDWKRVPPTIYHHFHQQWTISICDALNAGLLPPGYSALVEQDSSHLSREGRFHERANRIVIRHLLGDVVCAIEIVSPGNKAGKIAIREFVSKAIDFLRRGINLLVVDPFPPGPQDPLSLHKLIWDEFDEGVPFELPAEEPLLLASYRAAAPLVEFTPEAFIEPLRVGAELPDMPAWLDTDLYVNVPLEPTYRAAWDVCPADFRHLVEHGALPDENLPPG